MKKEEIFKKTVINSGVDEETVKKVYYGLIKSIAQGLREEERVFLDDWGEFKIVTYKKRYAWDDGNPVPTKVLKFSSCKSLKFYIKNLK